MEVLVLLWLIILITSMVVWSTRPHHVAPVGQRMKDRTPGYIPNRILVLGLARNIAEHWKTLEADLERELSAFQDYRVAFLENDSTDDSRTLLKNFAARDPTRRVIHCSDHVIPMKRDNRLVRMATLRNFTWSLTAGYAADMIIDYVVWLDLDLKRFEGLTTCFTGPHVKPEAQAILSAGWNHDCQIAYDTLAYEPMVPGTILRELQGADQWTRVKSAFGGCGVYHYPSVQNLSLPYHAGPKADLCEHKAFHAHLDQVWINPWLRTVRNE